MSDTLKIPKETTIDANGKLLFNGLSRDEIVNRKHPELNFYEASCAPRLVYTDEEEIDEETYEQLKNLLTCIFCKDILSQPVNVKSCLHKFCASCIEKYNRVEKKECPSCRGPIGCRRKLRPDTNISGIIDILIPDRKEYDDQQAELFNTLTKQTIHFFKQTQQKLRVKPSNDSDDARVNSIENEVNAEESKKIIPIKTILKKRTANEISGLESSLRSNEEIKRKKEEEIKNFNKSYPFMAGGISACKSKDFDLKDIDNVIFYIKRSPFMTSGTKRMKIMTSKKVPMTTLGKLVAQMNDMDHDEEKNYNFYILKENDIIRMGKEHTIEMVMMGYWGEIQLDKERVLFYEYLNTL